FMIGIEFSNENKSPISVKPYIDMLLRNGVIMYKAGMFDNVLRYMAPLTIPKLLIDRGLEKFEDVIKSTK
ncbi:aspartate aminotransferase family protein, partial [Sulfolobus sp. A20-N-F6]